MGLVNGVSEPLALLGGMGVGLEEHDGVGKGVGCRNGRDMETGFPAMSTSSCKNGVLESNRGRRAAGAAAPWSSSSRGRLLARLRLATGTIADVIITKSNVDFVGPMREVEM